MSALGLGLNRFSRMASGTEYQLLVQLIRLSAGTGNPEGMAKIAVSELTGIQQDAEHLLRSAGGMI